VDADVVVDGTAIVDAPVVPEPVDAAPSAPDAQSDRADADADGRSDAGGDRPVVTCTTCVAKQSCAGAGVGLSVCGPQGESCCTSLAVPGGTFYRSYDGVSCPGGDPPQEIYGPGCYTHKTAKATVSAFQLDKFEVTVARFRRFMSAVVAGWRPPAGAGVHRHLRGGAGVEDVQGPGTYEAGWDPQWNVDLFATQSDWDRYYVTSSTATQTPTQSEDRPIGGVSWAQAYAFCIWDGGFLPTEAEWNFAAAGGEEQRIYPWVQPPELADAKIDCAHARSQGTCAGDQDLGPVGATSPHGDGRWGHTELAGNRAEWTLDWFAAYASPCDDCARLQQPPEDELPFSPSRVNRGLYAGSDVSLLNSYRGAEVPLQSFSSEIGVRCARPLP
jgi:formylglycine-generating enzyme required for sulfatase activity